MRNVEFKAELKDLPLARSVCIALGGQLGGILDQTDTYYRTREGRLKKRETVGEPTEWILYDREDLAQAKLSRFKIYSEAEAAEKFGRGPLAVRIVVRKVRELYILGNVRIHLDQVEGLGSFLEFEALVSPRQNEQECRRQVADLKRSFSTVIGETIAVGYADLLEGNAEEPD